jgi:hypothetical protein
MEQGKGRGRTYGVRMYGFICLTAAALGLSSEGYFWGYSSHYELSVIFLVLAVLLVPICLLFSHDSKRHEGDRLAPGSNQDLRDSESEVPADGADQGRIVVAGLETMRSRLSSHLAVLGNDRLANVDKLRRWDSTLG